MNCYTTKTAAILAMLISLAFTGVARAQEFEASEDKLFMGWLDLEQEAQAAQNFGAPVEYGAYAIVQTGGENLPVIYVIFSNFKGKLATLGAFRCDKEFQILQSTTNGLRDIKCTRRDEFDVWTTTTLKLGDNGLYFEHF